MANQADSGRWSVAPTFTGSNVENHSGQVTSPGDTLGVLRRVVTNRDKQLLAIFLWLDRTNTTVQRQKKIINY